MPADMPRDDRDSPYGRSRDDTHRDRRWSPDRDRDRERGYDRGRDRSPPPRRRSISRERSRSREGRSRRNGSNSPLPRDDRDRERGPCPRNEGRGLRGTSRSRSPSRRKGRASPSPPPDGPRFRRDFSSDYRDSPQRGYGQGNFSRGRGWPRGLSYPYPSRGGYQGRPSDPNYNYNPTQRTPPDAQSSTNTNSMNAPASDSTDPSPSDSSVPAGPASWRRAQQYRQDRPYQQDRPLHQQDRPYQQDYRPNFPPGRGATLMNPLHRHSPFQSTAQSPGHSPRNSLPLSPTLHRVPTGPRALGRPPDAPAKKEYISPVPELDDQVRWPYLEIY